MIDPQFAEETDGQTPSNDHYDIQQSIEDAAHFLPAQGPITVFVHHNTLHAFEHLDFDAAVQAGGRLFGCHAYLPEERYWELLERGRIRVEDLEAVLLEDLGDEADRLVSVFCTRFSLRLSMLQYYLRTGPDYELRWVVAESDALRRFREDVSLQIRTELLSNTRKVVLRRSNDNHPDKMILGDVLKQFAGTDPAKWRDQQWESFVLNYLWRVCVKRVSQTMDAVHVKNDLEPIRYRHRDHLLAAGGGDADLQVHQTLIGFCAAFLDQGFAAWTLPDREHGFYQAFLRQHARGFAPTRWYHNLRNECRRLLDTDLKPIESIAESLKKLGVFEAEQASFIRQSLLALRGWAGMIWQLETNAEWMPHPARPGSLTEFLAIRLLLDRLSLQRSAAEELGFSEPLDKLRDSLPMDEKQSAVHQRQQRAFTVFQLAQVLGWKPHDLESLAPQQWQVLFHEIESFSSLERRRIYHRAYERRYRNETLDAIIAHAKRSRVRPGSPPLYQFVCCLDEREESFRRNLEEVQPACETLGMAGFFGVAMYYRGASDAHFTPLCPVNLKPNHHVIETPVYSAVEIEGRRADARRRIGRATFRAHRISRTFLGGLLTGFLGSLVAIPLVARILWPRTTAKIRHLTGSVVRTASSELRLERLEAETEIECDGIGYRVEEMADIVEGGLRGLGLAAPHLFSRLVVICGHGSASLNNPHEAAHDCGACGGGRGGPNSRAFAQMANDSRVRAMLQQRGLAIPHSTLFVGTYHNTCDDSMTWYDLDRVPFSHRKRFEQAKSDLDEARQRNAHERCRRFESAETTLSFEDALRHVEERSEDLSQTRPEYGHATNAICLVGRRAWSRGLFLDRRAFLTSYDPTQDDEHCSILERLLQAVIPVCAGINLEYYFSYVDPIGYGCGTKLPHNITSLLGVMDGAASDLRPGLPWQMVEIHEPVRLLMVIETTPQAMIRIINDNESIATLIKGGWVQLAVFDSKTQHVHRYVKGEFVLYAPHEREIPVVNCSLDWYGGQRQHLGFASIIAKENKLSICVEPQGVPT